MALRDSGTAIRPGKEHLPLVSPCHVPPNGNFGGRHTKCACYTAVCSRDFDSPASHSQKSLRGTNARWRSSLSSPQGLHPGLYDVAPAGAPTMDRVRRHSSFPRVDTLGFTISPLPGLRGWTG